MTKTTLKKHRKISQDDFEDGLFCVLCETLFAEAYGRPMACEECGGDGVLDEKAVADQRRWDEINRGYTAAKDNSP